MDLQFQSPPRRPRRQLAAAPLLAALACLALPIYGGIQLWHSRNDAVADAAKEARNLVDSLAQHAARTMETVDITLTELAERLAEEGAGPEALERIAKRMRHRVVTLPQVRELVFLDHEGEWAATSLARIPDNAPGDGDRGYFMFHKERADYRGMRIGTPILSRLSRTPVIVASRRVEGPTGAFAGVVMATLQPAFFQEFYRSLNIGKSGSIVLARRDGKILVREPFADKAFTADLSTTPLFGKEHADREAGSFTAPSVIDGITRTVNFRRLERYPLVSTVSLFEADLLAPWWGNARREIGILGAFTLVVLGLALWLKAQRRRGLRDQQMLRDSEVRYRLLADNTSDMIVLRSSFDGDGAYVSPACRRVLGYEPSEYVAIPSRALLHPDDVKGAEAAHARLSPECPQVSNVYRLRHKDGHWVWVEGVFRWTGLGGEAPLVIGSVRDVTERQRQAEELREAKEAAETASKAKTEFLAAMSHEVRTPLNGILGFADILLDDASLSAEQRRKVERVQTAGSALLTVVNDILDFSKVEAGKIELLAAPFSLRALADAAVSIVSSVADTKGIALNVVIDPAVQDGLVGDEARLRQVLLNLLNNAIKFTRKGAVTLAIAEPWRSNKLSRLRVSVIDTGIGIPFDKQSALFKRFSQVDGSVAREFGGTGLGLAISKRLVELMNGQIGVDSVEGSGSTFWFDVTLPHADAALEARAAASAPRHARPLRILLAEDLEINREIASTMLRSAGHRVVTAVDGAEALAAVQRETFDLVLMDVQMPNMDGLEATRRIRTLRGPHADLPIIAMTANVLPEQLATFREAGMTDHLGKPFQRTSLYAVIARHAGEPLPGAEGEPDGAAEGDVLDRDTRDKLGAVIGHESVGRLMIDLARELRGAATAFAKNNRELVARESHKMVAATGMLGFTRLSRACSALEAACLTHRPFDREVADVQAELAAALKVIAGFADAA